MDFTTRLMWLSKYKVNSSINIMQNTTHKNSPARKHGSIWNSVSANGTRIFDNNTHPFLLTCKSSSENSGSLSLCGYNNLTKKQYLYYNIQLNECPQNICLMSDNFASLIAVGSVSPNIKIFDIESFTQKSELVNKFVIDALARNTALDYSHAAGDRLACAFSDKTSVIWDVESGKQVLFSCQSDGYLQSMSWNESYLLSATNKKAVIFQDIRCSNGYQYKFDSAIEKTLWNPGSSLLNFLVYTEDHILTYCDIRNFKKEIIKWNLSDKRNTYAQNRKMKLTAMNLSCSVPGLLLTANGGYGIDVWDIFPDFQAPQLVKHLQPEGHVKKSNISLIQTSPHLPWKVAVSDAGTDRPFSLMDMANFPEITNHFEETVQFYAKGYSKMMDKFYVN